MKIIIHAALLFVILSYSLNGYAELIIEGSSDFKSKVKNNLVESKNISKYLARLVREIDDSFSTITIKPITNDKKTWHKSGQKSRSHTKPLDEKNRGAERNAATNSIIYINTYRITQTHKTYSSGTLIHEIVHALDLANGNYHGSYPIREKRAVFFQNIWRDKHSRKLRADYHGRFETKEYQNAKKNGRLREFVSYYFDYNDTP